VPIAEGADHAFWRRVSSDTLQDGRILTAVPQFGNYNSTSRSRTKKKASFEDSKYGKAFGVFENISRYDLLDRSGQSGSLNSKKITHAIQTIVVAINERVDLLAKDSVSHYRS
jgi:hypothetical protein